MTGERNMTEEWGVRTTAGGATATYGPYATREHAKEVCDQLVEGGGRIVTRRVTDWVDAGPPHRIFQCVQHPVPGTMFTPEAAASLVGQRPRFTPEFDYVNPAGRCTIVAATLRDDGALLLDIEFHEGAAEAVEAYLAERDAQDARYSIGLGYTGSKDDDGRVYSANVCAVSGVTPPPTPPQVVLDDAAVDRLGAIFPGRALDQQITNAVYLQEKQGWTAEQTSIDALRRAKARRGLA